MSLSANITESPQPLAPRLSTWKTISMRNDGSDPVACPDILAAGQLDRSDIRAIADHVCIPGMSDAGKALDLFEFMKANVVKWALPSLEGAENPMQILNVFGYCNCGGFSSTLATLATATGLKARNVHLPGHGVTEIWHDDAWHLYDSNLQVTYAKPDGQFASVEEVQDDLALLNKVDHDFHAPRGFNLDELRNIYGQHHVFHPDMPALDALHCMGFELQSGETITWYRDGRARHYPYQNDVFIVEPPPDYVAGGTLQFSGNAIGADEAGQGYSLGLHRRVPWAIVGGRVRLSGYRTPGDGQVSLLLKREDQELTVGGILTERRDCEEAFDVVFDFSAAAVLPPPAPVLYDLELVLVLFKQRSESELRFDTVQVEIDLQRAPQTLPAEELGQLELVYRDKSGERQVSVTVEGE